MQFLLLLVLFVSVGDGAAPVPPDNTNSSGLGSQGPLPQEFKFLKILPAEIPDFSLWYHTEGVVDICFDEATRKAIEARRGGNYFAGANACPDGGGDIKPDTVLYYAFYTQPGKQGRYAVLRYQFFISSNGRRLEGVYCWYDTAYRSQLMLNGLWVDVHMEGHDRVGSGTFLRWLLFMHSKELEKREADKDKKPEGS